MELVTNKGKLRERSSIYDITINTNKSLNSNNSIEFISQLKDMLKSFLVAVTRDDKFKKFITDMGKVGTPRTEYKPASPDIIKKIDISNTLEANINGRGFLHSHTIVKILHTSRVQINMELFKKVFYRYSKDLLTIGGKYEMPYIHVKGVADTAFNMENYVKGENRQADIVENF